MLAVCRSGQKRCPGLNLCGPSVCVQNLLSHSPTPAEENIFIHQLERDLCIGEYTHFMNSHSEYNRLCITGKYTSAVHLKLNPYPNHGKAPKCHIICGPMSPHLSAKQPKQTENRQPSCSKKSHHCPNNKIH